MTRHVKVVTDGPWSHEIVTPNEEVAERAKGRTYAGDVIAVTERQAIELIQLGLCREVEAEITPPSDE